MFFSREDPATKKAQKKLRYAALFCFLFMCVEIAGGIMANSLAILSDAAHLLADLAGLFISIIALVCQPSLLYPSFSEFFRVTFKILF